MSSEAAVVRQLFTAARALREAEDALRPDTEHLRDELRELLEGVDVLFDKLHFDHLLLDAQEALHGLQETSRGSG